MASLRVAMRESLLSLMGTGDSSLTKTSTETVQKKGNLKSKKIEKKTKPKIIELEAKQNSTEPIPKNEEKNHMKILSPTRKKETKRKNEVPQEPRRNVRKTCSPSQNEKSKGTCKEEDNTTFISAEPRRNQRRGGACEHDEEQSNIDALESLASLISNGCRVVIVTGAGLSTASGIPAFRSSQPMESKYKDDGTIWGRHVESMGTRSAFLKDPLFWYSSFWLQSFAPSHMKKVPSAGHEALSELTSLCPQLSIVTQNVDGLQQSTWTQWDHKSRLIEAHGRVGLYRCSSTNEDEDDEEEGTIESVKGEEERKGECPFAEDRVIEPTQFTELEQVQLGHETSDINETPSETPTTSIMKKVPICPYCQSDCLPLALLFDEDYTDHMFYQFDKLQDWFDEAEVFVFIGTSFSVTLTSLALQVARSKKVPMFNFNTHKDMEKAATKTLKWNNICGKAEDLLPRLVELVKSRSSSKNKATNM